MKASLVLSVLACALSATASSIRRKHSNDADNGAEGFTHHGDTSHLSKYEYHKHYIEETNENPYEGKAAKCVPRSKLEVLLDQYISTFSGIEDGGRTARKTFDEDLKIYSQTRWWITTAVSGDLEKNIEKWAKADSFPPIFENRAQFIKASIRKNNPNQWKKELVIYGCNTFTFFWKGDFSIPEYPTVGRTYGIHMVFVNPKTSRVNRVYSEYNSLNHMYNLGAHITWAKDPALPLLKAAYDRGLNTWDTANSYSNGISEVIVGKAIKDYDIPREKLVILTKCNFAVGETPEEQQFAFYSEFDRSKDYQNQFGLSRIAIFNQVEASLKRLGTTYIDLLQIHRFDSSVPIEETLKALHDLVQSGKVRYIGASSMWATQFAQLQFCAEKNGWTKFVSMQDQYNLLYREEEREMIRFCNETGVGLIPWAPLCRGYLARPPSDSTARASIESDLTSGGHGTSKVDLEIIGRVTELAKKREWPMALVALAWINKRVTSPIIGCSSIKRIDEAVGSSGKVLTDEEERYLEELYQPRPIWGHI